MSHFYGRIEGQAGEATRTGSVRSGYAAWAQNGTGRVAVDLDHVRGRDRASIVIDSSTRHYGPGRTLTLISGLDLSAIVEHSDDPGVRRHVDRARKALEAADTRARKLAKVTDEA